MAKRKKNKTAPKKNGRGRKTTPSKARIKLTAHQKLLAKLIRQDIEQARKQHATAKRKKTIAAKEKLARQLFADLVQTASSFSRSKKVVKAVPAKPKKNTGFAKNNFNHIRSLLWKEHKKDFKSYVDANLLRIVKEIYNDCKAVGESCTDEVILQKYKQLLLDERRPEPVIDKKLLDPVPYFNIDNVDFRLFFPYLWIVSPMIIAPPAEFIATAYYSSYREGDTLDGYYKYFKEWVDWCNDASNASGGGNADPYEICYRFLPVRYDEDKKRWQTEIIICTTDGSRYDFGFSPKGTYRKHETDEYLAPTDELVQKQSTPESVEKKHKEVNLVNALNDFFAKIKKAGKKLRDEELKRKLKEQETKNNELLRLQTLRQELFKMYEFYKEQKNVKMMGEITKEIDLLVKQLLKLK